MSRTTIQLGAGSGEGPLRLVADRGEDSSRPLSALFCHGDMTD